MELFKLKDMIAVCLFLFMKENECKPGSKYCKCERYMNYLPLVGNDSNISGMWNLADRLIQQVALQQKNGQDPDSAPVEMNVKQMIRQ